MHMIPTDAPVYSSSVCVFSITYTIVYPNGLQNPVLDNALFEPSTALKGNMCIGFDVIVMAI